MNDSKILLVDDDPAMIQIMGRILSALGQVRFATNGTAALAQARELSPDLMLLDAEMPGMSGYEVCDALKADPALRDIPVIFVTAHAGAEFELKGLESGAVDFIAKPISEPLLIARVKTQLRMKKLTDDLRRIATIDALTEVANRRSFEDSLAQEWKRGLRDRAPISVLLIDVDHFKLFNDRYGHPAGDTCLRSVAQVLRRSLLRPADTVARYGGEEFALLLPQTPRAGAESVAHRVLDTVASLAIPHEASPTARSVSVSIGIGSHDADSKCWVAPSPDSRFIGDCPFNAGDLVRSADQALYAAKSGGRAQAWWIDIAQVDQPGASREIGPSSLTAGAHAAG